jgi:uncharacterized heparinase superfamily protein
MARKAKSATAPPAAAPGPEPEGDGRLLRVAGDRGLSLSERIAAKVDASLYKTPLNRLRLRGRFPLKLRGVPSDPVAGDAVIGERIVAGRLIHAGHTAMTRDIDFGAGQHPAAWREWADGWGWLRDLAAKVPDRKAAAAVAEPLVARWLARFGTFELVAWRPDVTGRRLLFAFAYAPLVLSSADLVYRSALLSALATWARHLDRAAFRMPEGVAKAEALAGLYAAGVLIPGGEARTAAAMAGLEKLLGSMVAPDGGVSTRAPVDALALAQLLVFAGNCSAAISMRPPPLFADTLARLVPSLKGMVLGDGIIGGWHGGAAIGPEPLEALAKQAATGQAMSKGGRWSGYHRLSASKTVLVVDTGPPPLARVAAQGHAGTLAFELSDGTERVITNCGGERGLKVALAPALAAGLRTTAAHSTLTIADTNSTRIRPGERGALGLGVEEVTVQVRSSEQGHWLEAGHDGYAKRFAMMVERRLFLSPDGQDLRGEDVIEPARKSPLKRRAERDFAIRFHLGPGVDATPTVDGAGALLKLGNGRAWAMKTRGGQVNIEQSLWVDAVGTLHKTQQLVITARTERGAASIGWSFRRAGK